MTEAESDNIHTRLELLQKETLTEKEAAAESIAPVELDQARIGRLSRMDSMQQQAMALEQDRRRDILLKRIEGAFLRVESGTYGRGCRGCGRGGACGGTRTSIFPSPISSSYRPRFVHIN